MQEVMKALALTLVHSLWQGLLAAFLAAVIISATRKSTAKLRYNLLGLVLVSFLAVVCINFLLQWQQQQQLTALALGEVDNTVSNSSNNTVVATASEGFVVQLTNWLNNNTSLVLGIWVVFFSINCLKLFMGISAVNRMRNYKVHPVTTAWKMKLEELRDSLGIQQSIDLLQSELVKVPVALGYFKPVILLPLGWMANIPPEQVETILLHELGHIRRRDYLVNFIQKLVETIFFFNPGMLWVSSLLRQEREACCDDIVLTSSAKRNYLNALVAFQEYSIGHTPYTMAITSKRHYLLSRVKRILTNENHGISLFEKTIILAGVILFSAFTFIPQKIEGNELVLQQISGPVLQYAAVNQVALPVKAEKLRQPTTPIIDTLPVKKDKAKRITPTKSKEPLPTKKVNESTGTDVARALQEIIDLKEQIGVKKESIGKKKEQLKTQSGIDKDETQRLIENERREIDGKRDELDKKRKQYESLKEQEEEKKKVHIKNLKEQEQENKARPIDRMEKMEYKPIYEGKIAIAKVKEGPADIKTAMKALNLGQQKKTKPLIYEPKPLEKPEAPRKKAMPVRVLI